VRPRLRKAALTAHITSSVGWLGAAAGFLALAATGTTGDDVQSVRASYMAMEPLTTFVLVPLASAALVTGLAQSLVTPWGLVRHYWVVVKLVLTVFAATILLTYTRTVAGIADAAADPTVSAGDLRSLGTSPVIHAVGGLVILLATTGLSVFKPRGMTRYGQRTPLRRAGRRG
jgi:hypothetical protein